MCLVHKMRQSYQSKKLPLNGNYYDRSIAVTNIKTTYYNKEYLFLTFWVFCVFMNETIMINVENVVQT